jgi:hypothetical protein
MCEGEGTKKMSKYLNKSMKNPDFIEKAHRFFLK